MKTTGIVLALVIAAAAWAAISVWSHEPKATAIGSLKYRLGVPAFAKRVPIPASCLEPTYSVSELDGTNPRIVTVLFGSNQSKDAVTAEYTKWLSNRSCNYESEAAYSRFSNCTSGEIWQLTLHLTKEIGGCNHFEIDLQEGGV